MSLRDAVNALAQQGFRVHPDAHSPGAETFWRGGERGAAIVTERVPGVLTESCDPPPGDRPGGLTLKWLDHRNGRRLGALFSAMADEGCRYLVDNVDAGKPELGSLVACAVGDSTRRDYRLLVPQGNSGRSRHPMQRRSQCYRAS